MRSTLYSGLWRTALPGSQQVLAFPVSDYMILEQLEGHGLVSVGFLCRRQDMVNSERVRRLSAELIPLRRKRRFVSISAILASA